LDAPSDKLLVFLLMKARVVLEREAGAFRPAYGPKDTGTGDLYLIYRSARNRRIAVVHLLGAEPNLYGPKLVELSANRLRFVGHARMGEAWHLQEWICELCP
jgi:hypothetical protein